MENNHNNEIQNLYKIYIDIYRSDKIEDNQEFIDQFFQTMKNEWNRLLTFENGWDNSLIDSGRMAFAGFFYLFCDRVQCAFCKSIVYNWTKGEDPVTAHATHFPRCPFIMEDDVGNEPIDSNFNLYQTE